MTYVQFIILARVLELSAGSVVFTQQIVANERRLDKAMVSNVVKTLVSKGWLIRKEHAEDKRAYVLTLTEKGEKTAWKAKRIALDIDRSFFASVDRKTLTHALVTLLENNKK